MKYLDLRCIIVILVFLVYVSTATNTSFVDERRNKLKILGVFGHPGKSHFDVFLPLLEELARRGHDVTVLSHYPRDEKARSREPLPNYRDISLRSEEVGIFLNVVDLENRDHSWTRVIKEILMLRMMASLSCESVLRNRAVLDFARSGEKFDLVLTENFNTECFLAIVHQFDAPFVALSSHQLMPWANNRLGNPDELSYMPVIFHGLPKPLSFFHRVVNVVTTYFVLNVYDYWFHSIDQALAIEAFGPDVPDLREIGRNTTALLVNTHYSLHGSRPFVPNVIEIGGLHIPRKAGELPRDIAKFLDEAKEGVLYFNLGSMIKASSMSTEKLDLVVKVIGSIPRKVIWKWEAEDLPHKPENVLVRKWLPQFEILSHPNVKCYMGHGGLLGLSEGIYNGVPMVLLPIFGDQFHNAAAAADRGIAVVLNYAELSESILRNALDEVFNNTRYRENARRVSKAYRDRPSSPLETAVWWTEYIARGNGLPYLKSEGANLPWYQRHLVDVALLLLAVSLVLLYSVYRVVGLLRRALSTASKTKAKSPGERRRSKKKD